MIALFIETVPENLAEMNTALQNENWDMISKTAHKLKSTFDSMGIHSLSQVVRTVESTSKKKEVLENLPALIRRINQVIGSCITQLEAELAVETGRSVTAAFPQ
jgi:HPt (histidine-containing phosphotransfer) domain-containing protein